MKLTIPKTMSSFREIEYTESFSDMWKQAKAQNIKISILYDRYLNFIIFQYLFSTFSIYMGIDFMCHF